MAWSYDYFSLKKCFLDEWFDCMTPIILDILKLGFLTLVYPSLTRVFCSGQTRAVCSLGHYLEHLDLELDTEA